MRTSRIDAAIIGAGPYGLSLAAHLKRRGVPFRIFGHVMESWRAHMPEGMLLKSDGFASNISDPDEKFTLRGFAFHNHIEYAEAGLPVRLETFAAYGIAFQKCMVPELEDKLVVDIRPSVGGFVLTLDDGETLAAPRVIVAVGVMQFAHIPESLAHLPAQFVSHSSNHHRLERFRGRRVVVIGGGASALDLAGLLCDAGAEVELIVRGQSLKFHGRATFPRPLWQRIRYPQSGLGPSPRSRFYANWPNVFYHLPEPYRLRVVQTHLGPSGGWFTKDKVIGRVPVRLGHSPERAEVHDRNVHVHLRAPDGSQREVSTEHLIAATGYRVSMERLTFLSREIRAQLETAGGAPRLSSAFESSFPGLYFVGLAAANSFGPVMRFAFGARFAARRVTQALTNQLSRRRTTVPVSGLLTDPQSRGWDVTRTSC